jgi:hypothetical protein
MSRIPTGLKCRWAERTNRNKQARFSGSFARSGATSSGTECELGLSICLCRAAVEGATISSETSRAMATVMGGEITIKDH